MSDLSLKRVQEVTESVLKSITQSDWEGYIKHVKKLESELWQKDGGNDKTILSFMLVGSSPIMKIPTTKTREVSLCQIQNLPALSD